jgi:hypothetical protein
VSNSSPSLSGVARILVAIDLSERAEKALLRTAQLAMEHQATLEIRHCPRTPVQSQTGGAA